LSPDGFLENRFLKKSGMQNFVSAIRHPADAGWAFSHPEAAGHPPDPGYKFFHSSSGGCRIQIFEFFE
jgi:hypothetical protein